MNILIGVILLFIIYLMYIYNRLITLKNRALESISDIDVQLKRRYDLIPNLIETVKGYAQHEKTIFENIARLRSEAMQQKNLTDPSKVQTEHQISKALQSLLAIGEQYPELKASQNFLELQKDIVDTEDKLLAARRFYNTNVMAFNTAIQVFPNNIVANMLQYKALPFFEVENTNEKEVVQVQY